MATTLTRNDAKFWLMIAALFTAMMLMAYLPQARAYQTQGQWHYTYHEMSPRDDELNNAHGSTGWETINASAQIGVDLSNTVLEVFNCAWDSDTVGVRAYGSSLDRRMKVDHSGISTEYHGWNTFVQVDSQGRIEGYDDHAGTYVEIQLVGYFENTTYTELWQDLTISSYGSWQDLDVSAYMPYGYTAQILLYHNSETDSKYAGVRTDGSSLDRRIEIGTIKTGYNTANQYASFLTVTNATTGAIEYYAEDSNVNMRLIGYFDGNMNFTEMWTNRGASVHGTWQFKELDDVVPNATTFYTVCGTLKDWPAGLDDARAGYKQQGNPTRIITPIARVHDSTAEKYHIWTISATTNINNETQVFEDSWDDCVTYISGYFGYQLDPVQPPPGGYVTDMGLGVGLLIGGLVLIVVPAGLIAKRSSWMDAKAVLLMVIFMVFGLALLMQMASIDLTEWELWQSG